MQIIYCIILLTLFSVNAKEGNLRDYNAPKVFMFKVNIDNVEIKEIGDKVYKMSGFVRYEDWTACRVDAYRNDLRVVCLISENTINREDYSDRYSYGSDVNCNGNKINEVITYKVEKPNYYGCGVTDGIYTYEYKTMSYIDLSTLSGWIVAVIVIVVICCVFGSICCVYMRCKNRR